MSNRRTTGFLAIVAAWVALDQLTKALIVATFKVPGAQHIVLVPGWLDLTFTYNPGAAFGLLNQFGGARMLFIVIAAGALTAMWIYRRQIVALPWPQYLGLALVAGGAAGNLLDRLFRDGLVVDFIHFHIDAIGFVWPDFNVADIGVSCGMILYVVHSLATDLMQRPDSDDAEAHGE